MSGLRELQGRYAPLKTKEKEKGPETFRGLLSTFQCWNVTKDRAAWRLCRGCSRFPLGMLQKSVSVPGVVR